MVENELQVPPGPGEETEVTGSAYDKLPDVGFPAWVKIASVVVALLVVYSITRIPKAMEASIAEERGNRYFEKGQFEQASHEYEAVQRIAPDTTRVALPLAKCYLQMKAYGAAAQEMNMLDGKELDDDDTKEANGIVNTLNHVAEQMESERAAGKGAGRP